MMDAELPRHASWDKIGPDELVFVNKNGRRERGVEKQCRECQQIFVVAISGLRTTPNRGTYCSAACRNRGTNRDRKERGGYARKES